MAFLSFLDKENSIEDKENSKTSPNKEENDMKRNVEESVNPDSEIQPTVDTEHSDIASNEAIGDAESAVCDDVRTPDLEHHSGSGDAPVQDNVSDNKSCADNNVITTTENNVIEQKEGESSEENKDNDNSQTKSLTESEANTETSIPPSLPKPESASGEGEGKERMSEEDENDLLEELDSELSMDKSNKNGVNGLRTDLHFESHPEFKALKKRYETLQSCYGEKELELIR